MINEIETIKERLKHVKKDTLNFPLEWSLSDLVEKEKEINQF